MRRYRFEVKQELITPIEVLATNEREARELVSRQDDHVTPFETIYGDTQVVLRSVDED
jgi:hypothetical protein